VKTNSDRDLYAVMKRAISALLVAFVVFGGMAAWHYVSSERTLARVEQAERGALRMNARKLAALEREAERDAAAKAFAEKQAAELQAQADAEEQARAAAQPAEAPSHG
jgi:nitrate/nitrite-specific signal transduction histidine kinase